MSTPTTVLANGTTFPAIEDNGTFIKWSVLEQLPGFSHQKNASGQWEFTFDAGPQPAAGLPAGLAMVSSGGYSYPSFIVPSTEGGTGTRDLILATQVLKALAYPDDAIIHAMVAYWQYSEAMAKQAAAQGYPVLQQTQYQGKTPQNVRISTGTNEANLQVQNVTGTSKQPIANVDIAFTDGSGVQFP